MMHERKATQLGGFSAFNNNGAMLKSLCGRNYPVPKKRIGLAVEIHTNLLSNFRSRFSQPCRGYLVNSRYDTHQGKRNRKHDVHAQVVLLQFLDFIFNVHCLLSPSS